MNWLSLTHTGLSLIGVYALVQALVAFPSLTTWGSVLMQFEQGRAVVPLITVAPFAALVVVGCLLVTQPATVARWLSPPSDPASVAAVPSDFASLLFAAVGILVFAGAIPELVEASIRYSPGSGSRVPSAQWLAAHVIRALFGLFLFFRPTTLLAFWKDKQPRGGASPAA